MEFSHAISIKSIAINNVKYSIKIFLQTLHIEKLEQLSHKAKA